MDEIALLQQQLAAVQQQDAALKLSNHNVIDLLLKLQELGKVQVIHTRTGKQFLTPLQVKREIADYVVLHGGRLSLTELENLIEVDRTHVEKQVMVLCKGSRGHKDSYHVVNNGEEVLTSGYLDGIMEDTNLVLQESGTTSIGTLAQQYGFAVDYMQDVVRTRLGSILKARERENVLYTDSYVMTQKARVRGVFAGVTRPVFIPEVVRSFGFDEAVATEALTELIQTKVLMGMLKGREYIPFVFMAAQRENMYSFFEQNGYLEHSRARELHVGRPYDFLKKRFPDAVQLQKSVVSRSLQLQLEGAVETAVNDNSLVDVRSLLPSALSAGDVALLLGMSLPTGKSGQASKAYQIADSYAVSSGFIAACLNKFGDDATVKATCVATQQKSIGAKPIVHDESRQKGDECEDSDDEDTGWKHSKKGKRTKGSNKRENSEESKERSGKSGKHKKGKRGSKRGEIVGDDHPISIVPSREEMIGLLVSWFPVVQDLEGDDDFVDGMVAHIESKVTELYSAALAKALSSILRGDAASLRELRKTFEDRFDERFTTLLVLEKGFNKLSMHVDAKNVVDMEQLALVEVHLLESFALELTALVTRYVAESNNLELKAMPLLASPTQSAGDEKITDVGPMKTLSDENRQMLESSLPQSTANPLLRLWTLATGGRRSLNDFMAHVPILVEALNMPLRKLDRKKERQIIFGYRQATIAELDTKTELSMESNQQYALVASLMLQLFFQQLTGLPGSFPRDMSCGEMVLNAFKDAVPEKAMLVMQAFLCLSKVIRGDKEVTEEQKRLWSESLNAARDLRKHVDRIFTLYAFVRSTLNNTRCCASQAAHSSILRLCQVTSLSVSTTQGTDNGLPVGPHHRESTVKINIQLASPLDSTKAYICLYMARYQRLVVQDGLSTKALLSRNRFTARYCRMRGGEHMHLCLINDGDHAQTAL
ncbi:hypothetical protein PsorP6_014869 [Peronosclerospora sorghi]|uniref:Uncharacterized protein n=1 Tax=Peronosclerospora sorghi TaxID=230839 RepID=A0ACC0VRA9_9STRA|nr:hypothetical protein PsorP6_014869 [Peronosclerospora sorghi]